MFGKAGNGKSTPSFFRLLNIGVAVIALTSAFCFLGAAESSRLRSMYRMVKHGAWTEAWITGKTKDAGGNVLYSFQVGDHVYSGRGGMLGGLDRVNVGDRVSVLYDPGNPAMSSLGRAEQNLWELTGVLAVLSIVFGVFCSIFYSSIWYVLKRKKMNSQ